MNFAMIQHPSRPCVSRLSFRITTNGKKRIMKNWLKGILCFVFVACLGATVHAKTLKLGHVCSKDHSYQVASDYFAKRIAAETDGTIKVKVYPNAALGDEDTLVEGLQLGTVHLAVAAPGKLEGFVKELGIFGLPFLFRSMQHKYKVLDGEIGATMTKIIESRIPVKVLAYWQSGVRHLFNSKRPVYSPEDLTGSKIDCPVLPSYAAYSLRGLLP